MTASSSENEHSSSNIAINSGSTSDLYSVPSPPDLIRSSSVNYTARYSPRKRQRVVPDLAFSSDVNSNSTIVKPSMTKKRTQNCFNPGVPMGKAEVSAWRKSQRRIRNRISAAASRQKVRKRITELEKDVQLWKAKYAYAIDYLRKYEPNFDDRATASFPDVVSSCVSPPLTSNNVTSSPFPSSHSDFNRAEECLGQATGVQHAQHCAGLVLEGDRISNDQELEDFLKYAFGDTQ